MSLEQELLGWAPVLYKFQTQGYENSSLSSTDIKSWGNTKQENLDHF